MIRAHQKCGLQIAYDILTVKETVNEIDQDLSAIAFRQIILYSTLRD